MAVLVIIAIISAFALPGMQQLQANSRLSSGASSFETILAFAKSTAAIQRRTIVVLTTTTGVTVRQDTTTGTVLQNYDLPTAVTMDTKIASTTTAISNVQFTPVGLLQKTDGTAVSITTRVCTSAIKTDVGRTISVSSRGRITTRRDTDATLCNP